MKETPIRLSWLDAALGLLLMLLVLFVVQRITRELHYHWNWGAIPQFILRYDALQERWVSGMLLQGLLNTLRLSIWAVVIATLIGLVMGLFRVSRHFFRRLTATVYVESCRNLPPLVLIFIFYFFIGEQILPALRIEAYLMRQSELIQTLVTWLLAPPMLFGAFLSALLTLAILEGAYITEIVRGGIQSIEKGQWEAGASLGLSRFQQLRHVILPQAIPRMLPPLAGQFISTIKDSAIVAVISIQELTFQGLELMAATYMTFEIWITVALMYLLLTLTCSLVVQRFELYWRKT